MKVSKLIEQLQDFNPNADITLPCSEDICIGWICKDYKTGEELTKKTTPQLFIEFDEECPVCVHSYIDDGERFCVIMINIVLMLKNVINLKRWNNEKF